MVSKPSILFRCACYTCSAVLLHIQSICTRCVSVLGKFEDLIHEAKAKDITHKAKAKDYRNCPRGSSRPRTCPRGLHHWSSVSRDEALFWRDDVTVSRWLWRVKACSRRMHSQGNKCRRKLKAQPANTGSPGKCARTCAYVHVCVYVVCVNRVISAVSTAVWCQVLRSWSL